MAWLHVLATVPLSSRVATTMGGDAEGVPEHVLGISSRFAAHIVRRGRYRGVHSVLSDDKNLTVLYVRGSIARDPQVGARGVGLIDRRFSVHVARHVSSIPNETRSSPSSGKPIPALRGPVMALALLMPYCRTMKTDGRPPYVAVVRRGELKLFRFLQEHFGELGLVEVVWDRRTTQRRITERPHVPERRQGERRRTPPNTWKVLGFVLVRRR